MSNVVPEGWEVSQISKTCEILDSKRIPLNSQERSQRIGDYPYYGANGVQGYIDAYIFEGEHVLLAEDGGNFEQWESRPISYLVNGKFWVNNHAHILKAKGDNLTKFIHFSLVHKNILKHINGGTRSKLNQADMRSIDFLRPPLPEQKKIAAILTSVDEVIEKTQAQIDKLKDLKTAMMQELLTCGVGVEGKPHTEFKDSPVGRIPKGWEVVRISQLCSHIVDCVNKTAPVVDYSTPYKMIRTTNVRHGRVDTVNVRNVIKETYEAWTRRLLPMNGDLIFTREAPVGECGILEDSRGVFLGQRTMMYRADNEKTSSLFLMYSLMSEYGKQQLEDFSGGSTVPHMRVPDCEKILIKLPSLGEQKKIIDSLKSVDNLIQIKETKSTSLQNTKKALMQDLLTGKVRVKVD
ncbi:MULTISPECIES: restriction endonuclease subunit S [Vibrio]|uniref:restriction endonuclease subunit S n=1 Tax=Vibrio TaxID=662 RepID=UPI0018680351|nr:MULTISPECIES: restriction endonuclease subunit S [Vibrio]